MLTDTSIVVIAFAYIAALVFIVGSLYILIKWIFTRKGPSKTYLGMPYLFTYPGQTTRGRAFVNILKRIFLFSSMQRDPLVRYSSLAFHWSLWIIIAAHSDIVFSKYFESAGISQNTLEAIGAYAGTAFAIVMIVFGAVLLFRRLYDRYLRKISTAADYFSILLIIAIGITGTYMRFVLPADFAYVYITPFVNSLITFSPSNIPSQLPFLAHFLTTLVLLIYFPFSKFMHPYSFFTNPTMHSLYHPGYEQGGAK